MQTKHLDVLFQHLSVLVVDDNAYMRKMVRSLLINIGVKTIHEAGDGLAGLDVTREVSPDAVILDWEMPLLNGMEFVRIVRSPGVFPLPDIPIIMLSAHSNRKRIVEAVQAGVNEFLAKPVSARALADRLLSIVAQPRATVQIGDYYGPEPRKVAAEDVVG